MTNAAMGKIPPKISNHLQALLVAGNAHPTVKLPGRKVGFKFGGTRSQVATKIGSTWNLH